MTRKLPTLHKIDHNREITKEADYEFLHHLQTGLLLALKEQGTLNMMQYRHAEELLKAQRRKRTIKTQNSQGE